MLLSGQGQTKKFYTHFRIHGGTYVYCISVHRLIHYHYYIPSQYTSTHFKYIYVYNNRFALAHLHGKCRRAVILEYFGEGPLTCETPNQCCDICESASTMVNCLPEIKAVIQAVNELPGSGEKKVSFTAYN